MNYRFVGSIVMLLACTGPTRAQIGQRCERSLESPSQVASIAAKVETGSTPPTTGGRETPDLSEAGATAPPAPTATITFNPSSTLTTGDERIVSNLAGRVCQFLERAWSGPGVPYTPTCWITPEYLQWRVQRGPLPFPLLLSNPQDPDLSSLLFGNTRLDYRALSGGRLTAGAWFDDRKVFGVEARGFLLEQGTTSNVFASGPTGAPLLGIPFFNGPAQQEDFLQRRRGGTSHRGEGRSLSAPRTEMLLLDMSSGFFSLSVRC